MTPTMLTIRETAERSGLARHYIRQLCLQHKIIYRKSGNKFLVNYEKFIDYLNISEEKPGTDTDGNTDGNIRALT